MASTARGVDGNGSEGWTPEIAYLRGAFEDAPIGIALVSIDPDSAGSFLRVNRALCELTGHTPQSLALTDFHSILHPGDVDVDESAMQKLLAGDLVSFQLEQRLLDARRHVVWVMVNVSLVRDANGKPLYAIRQLQDIEERKRFEVELGYLADHDPLTGLFNRRGFIRELTNHLAYERRYDGGGAVLFVDLDDFKYVNDTMGHAAGDEVISDVARIMLRRLRETDVVARLGGDEFAVLLPHASTGDAQILSESLLQRIRDGVGLKLGDGRRVSVSIGVADITKLGKDLTADDILVDADLAMYAAKESGKDRVEVASEATRGRMRSRVTWAERVRRGVREDAFVLHGQPIVDLGSDTVSQWELLLRLPGEGDELILPAQFLYTAERSGLILEIDRWVVSEGIRLIAEHRDAGRDLRLEVNLSGRSVGDPALLALIEKQLGETSIDPANLVLEVTETAAIANMDRARSFASSLSDLGCRFALDDFGAGFGSFYYLKYIPFDYVKIDGEFIRNLPASTTDQLILDSIVQMSKGLGKRTIAEFVGDDETIDVLKHHGVDYAQGYHLGRPQPLAEALAL